MNFNKLTNKRNGETFTKGTYNGIEVLRRDVDGYINATKMARNAGKLNHLLRFLGSVKMTEILTFWRQNYGRAKNGTPLKQGENEVNNGHLKNEVTEK